MLLLHDAAFLDHRTPGGHPERPERLGFVLAALAAAGLPPPRAPAAPAPREALTAVHEAALVDAVERLAARGGGAIDAETVVSAGSWRAATLAAGAAIEAARSARSGVPAFALVRPPGHHAERARAMGFCLLNNVAVAAQQARADGARRVAVVDIDVHHGNGTQEIFYDRADVLYVSTHNWPLYPGTGLAAETGEGEGEGFTLNLPLPHGTGEATWKACLDRVVLPALRGYRPDLLLVSAGFDAHWRDPLGAMRLSGAAYHWAAVRLREACPRIAAVLEGGYDAVGLAEGAAALACGLAGRSAPACPPPPEDAAPEGAVEALVKQHGRAWNL